MKAKFIKPIPYNTKVCEVMVVCDTYSGDYDHVVVLKPNDAINRKLRQNKVIKSDHTAFWTGKG